MASFVIHYLAGEMFLDSIDNSKISDNEKNNFRLGNLVVDSLGMSNYSRDEKLDKKMVTHFRDSDDRDKCIQIPNLNKFMNKYENLVNNNYSAMGYLFHLYTDKIFFEYLYSDVVEVLDSNMEKTNYKKDNCYVKVKKNNLLFKVDDFYSGSSIGGLYRDYSNMNKYLIKKYNIIFNYNNLKKYSLNNFINPGIDEINYDDVGEVLDKMNEIMKQSLNSRDNDLKIFNVNDIDNFMIRVVKGFNKKYVYNIKKLVRNR